MLRCKRHIIVFKDIIDVTTSSDTHELLD